MKNMTNNIEGEGVKEFKEDLLLNEAFQKIREDKSVTLKDLSLKTGISVRNLKKIESGDWDDLPASIYVESFLVKCESVLGVDDGYFLNIYKNDISDSEKEAVSINTKKMPSRFLVVSPKLLTKLFFALVSLIILFYFAFQLNYLLGDPKLVVTNPENDIITEIKELSVTGLTQADNKVYINENELFVDSNGGFSEVVPLQPGLNTIKIIAKNRLNKEYSIIRRVILEE